MLTKLTTAYEFAGFSWPRYVGMLPRGSLAKRKAEMRNRVTGPYYHSPVPNAKGGFFYLDSDFMPGLRWEWCDKLSARIHHTGWYSDEHGDGDKIRGLVMRLPKGRGCLAAWS